VDDSQACRSQAPSGKSFLKNNASEAETLRTLADNASEAETLRMQALKTRKDFLGMD
jgi:hypothetical protein